MYFRYTIPIKGQSLVYRINHFTHLIKFIIILH